MSARCLHKRGARRYCESVRGTILAIVSLVCSGAGLASQRVALASGPGWPLAFGAREGQRAPLLPVPVARPHGPVTQGGRCVSTHVCARPFQCLAGPFGRTCEIPCGARGDAPCPEDQRCVKDGPRTVCRPIGDSLNL
jgi:hypothetical protein